MDRQSLREAIEASATIAQVVVNYYFELKQCGMESEEALKTAIAYQHTIITMNQNKSDE